MTIAGKKVSVFVFLNGLMGAILAGLGDGNDATYLHSLGIPFAFEKDLTIAAAAILNALPLLPS
jgi:hypothetical protein